MRPFSVAIAIVLNAGLLCCTASAREWADATDQYAVEADLVSFNDQTAILKRGDHELAAIPIESLSEEDRKFLASDEAVELARAAADGAQTWKLRDGSEITGRVVDYADRDLTFHRRRGRGYVNDRRIRNLPEFYQQILPSIVDHFEKLPRVDRRAFQTWLTQQNAPRTIHVEGVVIEADNGDEYAVPFFLFADADLAWLKPRWDSWQTAYEAKDHRGQQDVAFLLQTLAAARQRDQEVQHDIALMKLQLQAAQAGVTTLWEVTLFPAAGQGGPPLWIVAPGRDSLQATANALEQNPGYVAGPVRRVSRR